MVSWCGEGRFLSLRVVHEMAVSLQIFDEIHSFLCCCITDCVTDEFVMKEWENDKNWRQMIEQGDDLGFGEVCVVRIGICCISGFTQGVYQVPHSLLCTKLYRYTVLFYPNPNTTSIILCRLIVQCDSIYFSDGIVKCRTRYHMYDSNTCDNYKIMNWWWNPLIFVFLYN